MAITVVRREDGILERSFVAEAGGEAVPGLLWSPEGGHQPAATVLVGHGRTGHKRSPYVVALARRCVARGWNAIAIDAPGHGDRRAADAGTEWPRPDPDENAAGWRAAIRQLRAEGVDVGQLGYWGLSMGTSLGLSLIAGDTDFRAAVLGLMHPNWPAPPGTRIRADAARLSCPVLFLVNWHDSRAPRAQAFELFDLIASPDKRLHAHPGEHGQLPDEALTDSEQFLTRYLEQPGR